MYILNKTHHMFETVYINTWLQQGTVRQQV